MKTKYLGLFLLLFYFNFSCSRFQIIEKQNEVKRTPSALKSSRCSSLLQSIFDKTGRKSELKLRFSALEKSLMESNESLPKLGELLSELQGDAIKFNDEGHLNQLSKLQNKFLEFTQDAGDGSFDFETVRKSWVKQRNKFVATEVKARAKHENALDTKFKLLMKQATPPHQKQWDGASKSLKRKAVISYIAKLNLSSELSTVEKKELRYFSFWFLKNKLDEAYDNNALEEILASELTNFNKVFKKLSRSEKRELEVFGKKTYLKLFNKLSIKSFKKISKNEVFKEDALVYLRLFSELEPRFEERSFFKWLIDNEALGKKRLSEVKRISEEEGFSLDIGKILRDSYHNFAPFQGRALIDDAGIVDKSKESVKKYMGRIKGAVRDCKNLDCVREKSSSSWFALFKSDFYKRELSCLGRNPVVLKSMVMDMGLVWGGFSLYYKANRDSFQRAPYEVIMSGILASPIIAEANCRASFKNHTPFGGPLPKSEVLPSKLKKTKRFLSHLNGVAFKGFATSAGLISLTVGMDHLALAMGESIIKPMNFTEILMLLPVAYLYHGVWMGFKNMTIINPIRHKILPRLAKAIERKYKVKRRPWLLQTGLDFGAYSALASFNNWDYLAIYSTFLFPFVAESFPVGNDIRKNSTLGPKGEVVETYTGEKENGVKTVTKVIEIDGNVQLQSLDIEVPDEIIDKWADEVLKAHEEK